jgi:hypothetical protein
MRIVSFFMAKMLTDVVLFPMPIKLEIKEVIILTWNPKNIISNNLNGAYSRLNLNSRDTLRLFELISKHLV